MSREIAGMICCTPEENGCHSINGSGSRKLFDEFQKKMDGASKSNSGCLAEVLG